MEQSGPATDMMETSEVKSVSEGSCQVNQLHNSTSNAEEDEQVSHNSEHEAERCSQAKDELQLDSEIIKIINDDEIDIKTEQEPQTCSQECLDKTELTANTSIETERLLLSLSNVTDSALVTPVTTLDVVESSPSVLEGTTDTILTFDAAVTNNNEQPSLLVTNCSTEEPSPVDDSGSSESPSSPSVQSTSKNSPTDSTTSGISNGPSTPSSDTVSSPLASSPQTSANNSVPSHPSSSPYDTDCSRKLISQIQRSLSQESLLDELESELLSCQLPEGESGGERKGSPPVNGLPTDQEGCMVVFEKCVQYKYARAATNVPSNFSFV